MAMDPNKKTAATAAGVVLLMGGLAWASVPFYSWFCQVTGFGGVTQVAEGTSNTILDREITIRFDATTDSAMPWEFKPVQRQMTLRIGEDALAFYEAYNPTDHPIAGQATYNVAPYEAGGFFNKIQCFCFTEQVLMPGERVQMPVNFFVDPEMVNDRDAKYINHITLSYTFYQIDLPQETQAALDKAEDNETDVN
ncbi:cytochrome c oxidase assembly protein [Puniceibacterium sp. IMCC21224]|uniref:cytochrome c oxidase assembly protein n=1 Tax=Puniceibacterium sp. IMCC21224 TaxID=1618204 RepID=UPI00064DD1C3|nr:cytochrome c oxidase assembly protein [Puniceibacterium sp. IMCC21224]KMK68333.1 cytochrome oxidase assembly factor [Puniceibacterium sp. IMCC21224]